MITSGENDAKAEKDQKEAPSPWHQPMQIPTT